MSPLFQTNGIIIKEEERGEADRVFTVFTEDFGKIRLHARGARKIKSKLAGRLALFNLINLHFVEGRKRKIITDAYVIDNFYNIKQDLSRLKIALYASKILDDLIVASERDERLWKIIPWVFESANKGQIAGTESILLRLFEVKLLDYLGYLPDFSSSLREAMPSLSRQSDEAIPTSFRGSSLRSSREIATSSLHEVGTPRNDNETINPFSFKPHIIQILHTLAHNHQEINQLSCTKKDLRELKQATELMMSVIY